MTHRVRLRQKRLGTKVKIMSTGYRASAISFKSLKIRLQIKKKKRKIGDQNRKKKIPGKIGDHYCNIILFIRVNFNCFL